MKVLLRNTKTGYYSAGAKGWVPMARQALDFITVPQAAQFALDQDLPAIEIVLKSEVLPEEVVVPVLSEWCGLGLPPKAAPPPHGLGKSSAELATDEPEAATG